MEEAAEVTIVYRDGCPNLARARRRVRAALHRAGRPLVWREWDLENPEVPAPARRYGSPTVLVGGRDVADGRPEPEFETTASWPETCRLYPGDDGALDGAPSVARIVEALESLERGGTP